jgi:hypothetical protein
MERRTMSEQVVVALIGSATGIIIALLEWTRRQNNRDHASNSEKLDRVIDKIEQVDSRVSGHIEWHLDTGSKQ